MTDEQLIQYTIRFAQETLKDAEGGHDWFHTERVYRNALLIAKSEPVDHLVVSLGSLLHDIADAKFYDGDEKLGPLTARKFLDTQNVSKSTSDHVVNIVRYISFKGGNFNQAFRSPELDVVQDADRLDAMGAIGIARAFHFGGFKNRRLYDPSIPPLLEMDKETYKKSTAPTINHFFEKLLLLKDKMNTAAGKRLAEQRHSFMQAYLDHFFLEWNGIE